MHIKQDEDFFWEGVDQGQLLAQKCTDCQTLRHPPLPRCAQCGSQAWESAELSGRGRVLTSIESIHPGRRDAEPRSVCLIDLAEGLRMVSMVTSGDISNGEQVELAFEIIDGHKLPVFRSAGDSQ